MTRLRTWAAVVALAGLSAGTMAFKGDGTAKLSAAGTVRLYCRLDFRGARFGGPQADLDRYFTLVTWPDEGAYDQDEIIEGYALTGVHKIPGGVNVSIQYRRLAHISGNDISSEHDEESVTFRLVRSDGTWKIEGPRTYPHVSLRAAIAFFTDQVGDYTAEIQGTAAQASVPADQWERYKSMERDNRRRAEGTLAALQKLRLSLHSANAPTPNAQGGLREHQTPSR